MKLKSTFTILLKDDNGDAKITFRKEKINEAKEKNLLIEKIQDEKEKKDAYSKRLFESILDIEGVEDEEGNKITKEDLINDNIYPDFIAKIFNAYAEMINKNSEAEEKKEG